MAGVTLERPVHTHQCELLWLNTKTPLGDVLCVITQYILPIVALKSLNISFSSRLWLILALKYKIHVREGTIRQTHRNINVHYLCLQVTHIYLLELRLILTKTGEMTAFDPCMIKVTWTSFQLWCYTQLSLEEFTYLKWSFPRNPQASVNAMSSLR